jgi:hypothetical protein
MLLLAKYKQDGMAQTKVNREWHSGKYLQRKRKIIHENNTLYGESFLQGWKLALLIFFGKN